MLTVVTGWSPEGYVQYGRRFAETFHRFWPADVNLVVYGELPVKLPRGEFRPLNSIPGCMEFINRHCDNPEQCGRASIPGWKEKEVRNGYSYRFDAVKFCRQGFIPENAAVCLNPDNDPQYLCWLDGDVVTKAPVPAGFIEGLLPDGYDVAYLGRGQKHSEIGFQLYKLTTSEDVEPALSMLMEFSEIYSTDEVFKLREWHSAFVFDEARRRSGVRAFDLTPGGNGHVWPTSPLGKFMDHLKGERKNRVR